MPTLNLTRSRYFPQARPGWIGTHPREAWPTADLYSNMRGFSVDRTDEPPPPPPKLDIILLTGNCHDALPLGHQLARDLGQGFIHLDLLLWLRNVDAMDEGEAKSRALGLLHPLTLRRFVERKTRCLSSKVVVEQVLLPRITQLVSEGARQFIITGFLEMFEVHYFCLLIAVPQVVVWVEQPVRWDVQRWMRESFGEDKCVFLENVGGMTVRDVYARLLRAFGGKAMTGQINMKQDVSEKEADEVSPENDMAIMLAKAALGGDCMSVDSSTASKTDADEMMVDAANTEDYAHVKRRDTPIVQDGFDEALDLLAGLEEYANGSMDV
ncbi:hypothetical protein M409DRAFT_20779 [Zasmidium cellare ATCC 36951]|uniref:Uncharacterized protein n=1 Tax=Zasmidium cellare ATCC 36951 TaxID=1080233 RepID=A0A6A6CSG7_ZASCE|nr:uncharacterized protein M409DRAFT_20779 [Zasmidium cellare ATCC 36951]KAF2168762.1 hypothetical protein M409DRAFT_20779 [Zasmidium cellare ATCC 36951]